MCFCSTLNLPSLINKTTDKADEGDFFFFFFAEMYLYYKISKKSQNVYIGNY